LALVASPALRRLACRFREPHRRRNRKSGKVIRAGNIKPE